MVSNKQFRQLALAYPEAAELPHFENISYRIGKKIFATLDEKKRKACLKLSVAEQDIFTHDNSVLYPVPNKWGKQGWTFVELEKVKKEILYAALTYAFNTVAPKKLRGQFH